MTHLDFLCHFLFSFVLGDGNGLDKFHGLGHFLFRVCYRLPQILPHEDGRFGCRWKQFHLLTIGDDFNQFLPVAFTHFHLLIDGLQFVLQLLLFFLEMSQSFSYLLNALIGASFHFNDPTVKFLHIFAKICHFVLLFVAFQFGQSFARSTPQSVGFN